MSKAFLFSISAWRTGPLVLIDAVAPKSCEYKKFSDLARFVCAARGHVSIEWPASAKRGARREREGKLHAHTFMLGRAWKNPPLDTRRADAKMELRGARSRACALVAINALARCTLAQPTIVMLPTDCVIIDLCQMAPHTLFFNPPRAYTLWHILKRGSKKEGGFYQKFTKILNFLWRQIQSKLDLQKTQIWSIYFFLILIVWFIFFILK